MVRLKRRRRYKTTDSRHHYRKYPNLIADVVPSRPNEIWVSDITYVETDEGVCYLSLITDTYSHKIVGWAVGPTLETVYPLNALKMALATIDDVTASRLIHHSDRGCQYCSNEYVSELKKRHVNISMTQSGDPLENAIAERANGILKVEWLYKMRITTRDECRSILDRIIYFYNTQRPHVSIGMQPPPKQYICRRESSGGAGKIDGLWDKMKKAYICQSVQVLRYRSTWTKPTGQTAAL